MYDCNFTRENKWFRHRAASIIIENGCVLLVGNAKENYYYSVGGAVHIGECSEKAVVREVFEETKSHYEVDKLVLVHENFFQTDEFSLKGLDCHELCFYYLMKPKGKMELGCQGETLSDGESLYWIPVSDLDKYRIIPKCLGTFIQKIYTNIDTPNTHVSNIEHMVTNYKKNK